MCMSYINRRDTRELCALDTFKEFTVWDAEGGGGGKGGAINQSAASSK